MKNNNRKLFKLILANLLLLSIYLLFEDSDYTELVNHVNTFIHGNNDCDPCKIFISNLLNITYKSCEYFLYARGVLIFIGRSFKQQIKETPFKKVWFYLNKIFLLDANLLPQMINLII